MTNEKDFGSGWGLDPWGDSSSEGRKTSEETAAHENARLSAFDDGPVVIENNEDEGFRAARHEEGESHNGDIEKGFAHEHQGHMEGEHDDGADVDEAPVGNDEEVAGEEVEQKPKKPNFLILGAAGLIGVGVLSAAGMFVWNAVHKTMANVQSAHQGTAPLPFPRLSRMRQQAQLPLVLDRRMETH